MLNPSHYDYLIIKSVVKKNKLLLSFKLDVLREIKYLKILLKKIITKFKKIFKMNLLSQKTKLLIHSIK